MATQEQSCHAWLSYRPGSGSGYGNKKLQLSTAIYMFAIRQISLHASGRGVYADSDLDAGHVVVSVPDRAVLLPHDCRYAGE